MTSPRVLILCTGNSCRSQIGEGWVRHDLGDRVEVPVMLTVCAACNRTRHWFPVAAPAGGTS